VLPLAELLPRIDVLVECATADSFPAIARAALAAGKHLVCVSAGGIPDFPDIEDFASRHGGRVQIATGAFPGFDAIRVAAEGNITSIRHVSRQKPQSMAHEQYVVDQGFDFAKTPPERPVKVFEGSAREAAASFPRHFNVAVSLSLAGIGLDRTHVEVWVDPSITGAIHTVDVESDVTSLTLTVRNIPSANPRTSRAVVPSILAALRALSAPLKVGS
jgi:aspartate dehydrogenase